MTPTSSLGSMRFTVKDIVDNSHSMAAQLGGFGAVLS
jgi:hypothetical protein